MRVLLERHDVRIRLRLLCPLLGSIVRLLLPVVRALLERQRRAAGRRRGDVVSPRPDRRATHRHIAGRHHYRFLRPRPNVARVQQPIAQDRSFVLRAQAVMARHGADVESARFDRIRQRAKFDPERHIGRGVRRLQHVMLPAQLIAGDVSFLCEIDRLDERQNRVPLFGAERPASGRIGPARGA